MFSINPNRLDRKYLFDSGVEELNNLPIEDPVVPISWLSECPDMVGRGVGQPPVHPSQQQAVAFYPKPIVIATPTQPLVEYPDRVEKPFLGPAQHLAVTHVPPKPEHKISLDWSPECHPDRVDRPFLHASQHHALRFVVPTPVAPVVFPDRIDRPFLHPSQQLAAAGGLPFAFVPPFTTVWYPEYPDIVRRAGDAALAPSQHHAIRFTVPTPVAPVVFPDAVYRPFLLVANQLAVTELPPFPIPNTTVNIWYPEYPDAISKAGIPAPEQLSFSMAAQPERTSSLATTVFPDRVERPSLLTANQLAVTELSPEPEETIQLDWSPSYPERVVRATAPVSEQLHFSFYPFPYPQAPVLIPGSYPDTLNRVAVHASEQLAVTEISPESEEKIQLDWSPIYPDRALHAWLSTADQSYFAFAPYPERASPLAAAVFPDRVDRPALAAANQLAATEVFPKPEEEVQLDWEPCYPERVLRPWLPISEYPFFASSIAPERTSPIAVEVHPDRIDRPALSAANQLAVTELSPKPEEKVQLDWTPSYPERVLHYTLLVSEQLAFAFSPFPLPQAPALLPGSYPDTLNRVAFHASQQLAVTEIFPKPEEKVQLDWSPVYPDRATRAWLPTAEQLAFATSQKPEETTDLVWEPVYPERVVRPWVPCSEQPFFAFAPRPERTSTLAVEVHPDRVDRPFLGPAQQLAVTEVSPKPERTASLAAVVFPDRVDRPSLFTANQLATTEVFPKPEEEVQLDWDPSYPDRASRAWLPTADQLFFAFAPYPERTSPLAVTVFPDKIDRPALLTASQLAVTELSPQPQEKVQLDWEPNYPDRALHAWLATPEQLAFAFAPAPERTSALAAEVHPDRVDRPFLGPTQQLAVTELSPKPEEKVQLAWSPVYPERVLRGLEPVSEQPFFAFSPFPLPQAPALTPNSYPDTLNRASFHASQQQAVTELSPPPERTDPLAVAVFPDRVDRPYLLAANQLAVTEIAQRPEEEVQLDWDPQYPDRALHAWLTTANQPVSVTEISPAPERTSSLAAVEFPARVERPFLLVTEQLAVTELSPKPERTAPIAAVVFPDRVERPFPQACEQLAYADFAPQPEDRVQLDWAPSYPDRALHSWLPVSEQQAFTASPLPIVFVAGEQQFTYFPDRIDRPFLPPANQLAVTEETPKPERKQSIAVAVFPDRIDRPFLHASQQLAAGDFAPKPERKQSIAVAVFPDRIDRPFLHASQQLAAGDFAPKPERKSPIAVTVFPDQVLRPSLHASNQLAVTELYPRPERTQSIAVAVFPDRIDRPSLHASQQLAYGDFAPRPEEKVQLDWAPIYPDRALHAWLSTAEQLAYAANTFPLPAPPTLPLVSYPDRVDRPSLLTANQLAVTELSPQPERTSPIAVVAFPDRVDRPSLLTANQLAVTELPPQPERTAPLAVTVFPDRVDRPFLGVQQQLAYGDFAPEPEERVQLDWQPAYPDRALHAWLVTAAQQAFVGSLFPITFAIGEQQYTSYPDIILRPYLEACAQLAVTELPPRPERTSAIAAVVFPDRVDHPFLLVANQQAVTEVAPRPEERVELDWNPAYPDRALRAALPVAHYPFFTTSQYPERTAPLFPVVFPDRVDRPFLSAANQQAVTIFFPTPSANITATGLWVQYAFLTGSGAVIGYRPGAFVGVLVGPAAQLRGNVPGPTSPLVPLPIAATTPPGPPQGPTPIKRR